MSLNFVPTNKNVLPLVLVCGVITCVQGDGDVEFSSSFDKPSEDLTKVRNSEMSFICSGSN